jgi:hypothetical protein
MATTSYNVTTNWALAVAGPKDINLCAPRYTSIVYRVAGSEPAANAAGHHLRSGDTHPVKVGAGENLYMRLADAASGTFVAVATDA